MAVTRQRHDRELVVNAAFLAANAMSRRQVRDFIRCGFMDGGPAGEDRQPYNHDALRTLVESKLKGHNHGPSGH